MKYLLLFGFLAACWWLMKKRRASAVAAKPEAQPGKAINMHRCHHCGVNFPENDGVILQGRAYCCDAHRAAASAAGKE